MDPAQVYETTVYNRDTRQAFAFAVVPARSLLEGVPSIEAVARVLQLEGVRIEPVEPWSLPIIFDVALGAEPNFPWVFDVPFPGSPRRGRGPSAFAQYLTYSPIIPFESSPLGGKSLAELITAAGGGTGAATVGAYATHDPLLLLTVPAAIIVCRAAWHVGDGIGIALRTLLLRLVGAESPSDEPPAT